MRLTKTGKRYITEFILSYARRRQSLDAWFSQAEEFIGNLKPGESGVVLEIRSFESIDGHAHDLVVPESMFKRHRSEK